MEKEKKPIYKKWWFWLIIGLVVLGIIGGAVGGGATSSSSGNTPSNNNNNNSQVVEYKMNDNVTCGDLQYTITMAYDTLQTGSLGEITKNKYVVITLEVKNNGSSEKTLTSSSFTYYRGNNKYEPSTQAIYLSSYYNPFTVIEKIGAGITKTLTVVFEIPSDHEPTDYLQVKDGYKSAKIYMK